MRPTAGRWVSGDDFFDREGELRVLESHVRDHNHLLLTGQRRMGKTSITRELGRRLEATGWIFLFADVEGSTFPEDAVATIAKETYPIRSIASRLSTGPSPRDPGPDQSFLSHSPTAMGPRDERGVLQPSR